MKTISKTVISFCLMALMIYVCESKGGRGGRGGRFRGGSSRGTGRVFSKARYSRIPYKYNARRWTISYQLVAIRMGLIYVDNGMHRSYYREYYHSYDQSLLRTHDVCRDSSRRFNNNNGSQQIYGWFICPLPGEGVKDRYCCGKANREYCCAVKNENKSSVNALSIIGTIVFLIAAGVCAVAKGRETACTIVAGIFYFLYAIITWPCRKLIKCCGLHSHLDDNREVSQRSDPLHSSEEDEVESQPQVNETSNEEESEQLQSPPSYEECVTNHGKFTLPADTSL